MSKTLLFALLALFVVAALASDVEQSTEVEMSSEMEIDIDATFSEMASVADSAAELLSMQTEAAKKVAKKGGKATNGVQRLIKMLKKVIRRTRNSLRTAGINRASQKKACKRIFATAKAHLPIAKAQIATLKTQLQLAHNAIARSKNDVAAFQKKVANAVSEGKRFDALQVTRRAENTLNANRLTAANQESQALVALLSTIKGNLKANGLAEISSELTDASKEHAEQEATLLAIAAAAEEGKKKGGNKGTDEVHDMIDLLIANLLKDIAANSANIKFGAATTAKLIVELSKSADSARANAKSYLKSQGAASAAGDKATKDVLAFNVRIKALESKIVNINKRVATTKVRCAASKKRFVGKKARSLKKIRVLKSIIQQLKNHKMSPAMVAKIAALKLNKAVWTTGPWGVCSSKCGLGQKIRAVKCSAKHCKGRKPAEKEPCTVGACKVACVVSRWTRFTHCKGGVMHRTRKILVRASNGGKACPSTAGLMHKKGCKAPTKANPKVVAKFAKKAKAITKRINVIKKAAKQAAARVQNMLKNVKQVQSKAKFLEVKAKVIAAEKRLLALNKKNGNLQLAKFEAKEHGWQFTAAGVAAAKFCSSKRLTGIAHVGCMQDIQLSGDKQKAAAAAIQAQKIAAAQRAVAPRPCQVSAWSAFGACSSRCGGGKQTRTRKVTAAAANGGKSCPTLSESQNCNMQACPVDCVLTAWSSWSACSKTCGGGVQTQTRKISRNAANGGKGCPTSTKQSQACNVQRCPPPPPPPTRMQAAAKQCSRLSCPRPPTIPRNVQNAPSRWATANGDPHQTNFNGDYYHMQLPQIITMAKTDDGLFEVQAYQDGWRGPGSYSVIREVKIRYGSEIFTNNFNRNGFIVQGGVWYNNIMVPGAYQGKMLGAFGANLVRGSRENFKDQNDKLVNVHWNGGGGAQHWGLSGYGGGSTGISMFQKAWKPSMADCLFPAARCAANLAQGHFHQATGRVCTPWGCIDMSRFR